MLIRAIILPKEEAEKLGLEFEPIEFYYLSVINTKVHFALSFVKDKKVNKLLEKYFRPFMIAMTEYEYKPTDYIISVSKELKLSLARPKIEAYVVKASKWQIVEMLKLIEDWIKVNKDEEVMERLRDIALLSQQLQLNR